MCTIHLVASVIRTCETCAYNPASAIGSKKEDSMLVRLSLSAMKIVAGACVLLVGGPLFAQEWSRYQNLDDRFAVTAPGQPTIERTKWKSDYDSMFPATMYRWQQGPNRYTVTVVDYSDSEAIYMANPHSQDFQAPMYWQIDILGSIQYAATQYRQKPGIKVTFDT